MHDFTPISAAIGGVMIGAAAAAFWLGNGRIAGISGILAGALRPERGDLAWRFAFLAGLIAAPLLWRTVMPLPAIIIAASPGALIVAGLLVGFGTRLGGGCTSGHGVCGVARLSPRSIAAIAVTIATALVTVFLMRHVLGAAR